MYRRRLQDDSDHSHHLGSDEDVSLIDMDQHRSHSSLSGRAHNKGVSWHDDTEVVEEDPEEDVDSAPGTSPSGESTSERVFTEEEAPSTSPSVDSLDAKHVPQATKEPDDAEKIMPSTAPLPIPIPVSSITSRSNLRSSSLREESLPSSLSSSQLSAPLDEKPSSSLVLPPVVVPTTQSTGLWGKLKGVRRPSSRSGPENLSEKKDKEAGGPDAPKEKKLGSRFVRKASAGKSALAGATARTAQAVGE